jgi:hypothetical protein
MRVDGEVDGAAVIRGVGKTVAAEMVAGHMCQDYGGSLEGSLIERRG